MPAVFRKLLILTLALMLLTCPALSESAGTLPGYPFPTEVEGYTFVSFADNPQLIMETVLHSPESTGIFATMVWEGVLWYFPP